MPKYIVTGYFVQNVNVTVEADNEDDALEIGADKLTNGEGWESGGDWQDYFDAEELDENEENK